VAAIGASAGYSGSLGDQSGARESGPAPVRLDSGLGRRGLCRRPGNYWWVPIAGPLLGGRGGWRALLSGAESASSLPARRKARAVNHRLGGLGIGGQKSGRTQEHWAAMTGCNLPEKEWRACSKLFLPRKAPGCYPPCRRFFFAKESPRPLPLPKTFLAESLGRIKPSPHHRGDHQGARNSKAAGRDVIGLGRGRARLSTRPRTSRMRRIKAINDGPDQIYTRGGRHSRTGAPPIAAKFQARETISTTKPSQTFVAPGRQGPSSTTRCWRPSIPGDEVIVPAGLIGSVIPIIALLGGATPVVIECSLGAGLSALTPEALEKAITPKTKWLIFNQPSKSHRAPAITGANSSRA